MAVNGLFTYKDLYAGKPPNHHQRPILQPSSSSSFTPSELFSVLNIPTKTTTTTTIIPTSHFEKLVLSREIESNTKLNKLADVIPFTYFYWLLVVLAILLTLTLIIVFICYCRTFFKNYKTRRESLASFYRYRTVNRREHTNNISKPTVPPPLSPLPTPPCPSKSLEYLNNELHRQDLDLVISPPTARLDLYLKEPLSTFTSSTSNLHSALHSRLSARSSDPPSKVDLSYESQRASMALDDEPKNDSLTIDIN